MKFIKILNNKKKNKLLVSKELSMVELTIKINFTFFCDFVKISFCSTFREGHTDTNIHMNTQTNIPKYRPK